MPVNIVKSTPLFFEREKGRGGKGKLSFPGKRKFSLSTAHSFTLIELLVVIAIIAILAAILLPTLKRAQERSKTTDCASRQKQVVAAVLNYAGDWDSFRPAATFKYSKDDGSQVSRYYCWLLIELNYLTKNRVLHCPNFPDATPSRKSATLNSTFGLLREGPYDPDGKRWESNEFVKIKSVMPTQDVMTADAITLSNGKKRPSAIPAKYSSAHPMYAGHHKKINLGFYDGHVAAHDADKLGELRSFRGKQPSALGKKYTIFLEGGKTDGTKLVPETYPMPDTI